MAQVATISARPASRSSIRSPSPSQAVTSPLPSSIPRPSSRSEAFQPPLEPSTPSRPPRSSRRRSSYEALAQLSQSKDSSIESQIPLPARTPIASETISEGVPLEVSHAKNPSLSLSDGRPLTPSRTLSRIPVSSVGNARALADEGRPRSISPLPPASALNTSLNGDTSIEIGNISTSSTLLTPITPSTNGYKRMSLGGGGTTKVLGDLQQAAVHARAALDNTRQQLRVSQRSVAQLTRQVEDLKDGRERLRLENEGLNNVVARKERLLQEVLERARKAEAEVVTLKASLKTEAANAKKSVATVSEAVTQSQKAQREYTTLRDSVASMREGWRTEVNQLKEEMRKRDEAWREEVKEVSVKYGSLVKLIKAANTERARVETLKTEVSTADADFQKVMREEIQALTKEVQKSTEEVDSASAQASELTIELARLRRLMRTAGSLKTLAQES